MTEQQQQKKKTRLIWRILRWIWLILLVLLLITAVFYQAPWKIITLLAIVLAACTVLPKPYRKWFWLSVAAVVVVLIIWILLPVDNEGWRSYTFEKELAELQAQYAIPDEQNAAFEYDEIFENLDINTNQPEFFVKAKPSSKDEPWLSKDHPQTVEWFKGHQDTIDKLLQASKKDECVFLPITADHRSIGVYMEHLPEARQCAFLLISVANNDIAEGRIDAALEKYLCVNQMAKHMCQQPAMIQHLVGFAIESLALQRFNRFVIEGRPESEQLRLISDSIIGVENNWSSFLYRILDFEKLYAKNMICSISYEVNPKGKIRYSRNPIAAFNPDNQKNSKTVPYFKKIFYKAKVIYSWFYVPPSPDKISEMIEAGFEKHYEMAKPDFDWDKISAEFEMQIPRKANYETLIMMLTSLSGPAYRPVHDRYLKNLALRRGSRLLIAIRQYHIEHGTWPDSLNAIKSGVPAEALIDPATGKDFEYENHGQRFSLFAESVNIWPK
jgi:hypothetical protein